MAKSKDRKGNKTREVVPVTRLPSLPSWELEFDRLFDRLSEDFRRFTLPSPWSERWWPMRELRLRAPVADVYEEKDTVVVKAELPGVTKDDIEVTLTGSTLTIKAEKRKEEEVKEHDYLRSERSYGAVSRSIELPTEVKIEEAQAHFKNGVLEIRLPKSEEVKKKRITLKVE